jgi:hypothetical protein
LPGKIAWRELHQLLIVDGIVGRHLYSYSSDIGM